tara:strand:- start:943 stop:1101 length:159 start_codon:yes stop_codon:yes gene_type:complete
MTKEKRTVLIKGMFIIVMGLVGLFVDAVPEFFGEVCLIGLSFGYFQRYFKTE